MDPDAFAPIWRPAVADVQARIPGLDVESIGGACPFQMEGTTPSGDAFYLRYRHDEVTLYVYPKNGEIFEDCRLYAEIGNALGADYDRGDLEPSDVGELFERAWRLLRPVEEFEITGYGRLAGWLETFRASRMLGATESDVQVRADDVPDR